MTTWKCAFCGKLVRLPDGERPFDSNNTSAYRHEYSPKDDLCGDGHDRLDNPSLWTAYHWYEREDGKKDCSSDEPFTDEIPF